ncbi:MAG: DUF4215 domain-containing protein [Myxococcota bacterium]
MKEHDVKSLLCRVLVVLFCAGLGVACEDDSPQTDDPDAADVADASDVTEDASDASDTTDTLDASEDVSDADADPEDTADSSDTEDAHDAEEDVEPDAAPVCGDGVVQPDAGEECDDGNLMPGDGCDENCRELTGTTRWALGFGGAQFDLGYGIATDSSGNVYAVGMFRNTVEFGNETLTATGGDVYLAKIDPSGSLIWTKHFGGTGDNVPFHVEVDSNDDVYVSGYFKGSIELSASTTLFSAGSADAFIAKMDSDGALLWSEHFGGIYSDGVYGFVLDDSDHVHAVGGFRGTVDFGDGEVTTTDAAEGPSGDDEIFVLEYDPSGQLVSRSTFGDGAGVTGSDIGVDADGNTYIVGSFGESVDFGGGQLDTTGRTDVFLMKLDASGQHVWSKGFGGAEFDRGSEIAVGSNVTVVGSVTGDVDFGGGAVSSNGGRDIFVAQFDEDGSHRWSTTLGGAETDQLARVEPTPDGDLLVTGGVFGDADLGGGVVAGGTKADMFVSRFDETGVFIWAKRAVGTDAGLGHELAVSDDGRIYATGYFAGTTDFGGVSLTSNGSRDIAVWALEP